MLHSLVDSALTISAGAKAIVGVKFDCDIYQGENMVGNPQLYAEAGGMRVTPFVDGATVTFGSFNSSTLKVVNDWTGPSGGTQLRIKFIEITYAE